MRDGEERRRGRVGESIWAEKGREAGLFTMGWLIEREGRGRGRESAHARERGVARRDQRGKERENGKGKGRGVCKLQTEPANCIVAVPYRRPIYRRQ